MVDPRARAGLDAKAAEIRATLADNERAERAATADRTPAPATPELLAELIRMLREMDARQQATDEHGGREVAWFYWRNDFEDALGLPRGALNGRRASGS